MNMLYQQQRKSNEPSFFGGGYAYGNPLNSTTKQVTNRNSGIDTLDPDESYPYLVLSIFYFTVLFILFFFCAI